MLQQNQKMDHWIIVVALMFYAVFYLQLSQQQCQVVVFMDILQDNRVNCLLLQIQMVNTKVKFIGNFCGYSPGYENYPYLFIWDITLPASNPLQIFTSGVCVKSCPNVNFDGKTESVICVPTKYLKTENKKSKNKCEPVPQVYNSRTCIISMNNYYLDIGNYCLPNLQDLGTTKADEEKIRKSYNLLLDAIGADAVGQYFGDIAIAQKVIYLCAASSFFIAYFSHYLTLIDYYTFTF